MDTVGYDVDGVTVEVRRSAKRRRTVSAYRQDDGSVVVLVPARLSRAEERRWVTTMLERLDKQDRRRRPSDDKLLERALLLSREHLEGRARPSSVRWVDNQRQRWGSCTPADGTIRLSSRLQGMPAYVVECVLLHELAHLLVHDHSAAFWELADRHPRAERAKGYLEGHAQAQRWPDPAAVDGEGAVDAEHHRDTDIAAHPGNDPGDPATLGSDLPEAGPTQPDQLF